MNENDGGSMGLIGPIIAGVLIMIFILLITLGLLVLFVAF